MFFKIIINFLVGLIGGFILEFIYRSITLKKVILPKFINYQMYGLTSIFLFFVYFLNISLVVKLILIFVFPTIVEFVTGYLYLKIKGIYLWDYSKEFLNFKGIICPLFSIFWFIISIIYYYLVIPILV
jgi:uncharacterized membrane protein